MSQRMSPFLTLAMRKLEPKLLHAIRHRMRRPGDLSLGDPPLHDFAFSITLHPFCVVPQIFEEPLVGS